MKPHFFRMPGLIMVVAVLLLAGCVKEPVSVQVSPSSLSLTEGESAPLSAKVMPEDARYDGLSWTTSNSSVATVQNGLVTAVGPGSATITATAGAVSGSAAVTVKAKVIPVTGVSLDKTSLTLTEGETETLKATVSPDNATDKSVTWSSADPTVATVDDAGKVTAVKAGQTTITVKTKDGGKQAACALTVNAKVIPVTGVSLDKTSLTLTEGETETLKATVSPDNATDKSVTWSSADPTVATVDDAGKVTAVKAGQTTITVKTKDGGKQAACALTVNAKVIPVTGVSLDQTEVSLYPEETVTLKATVEPDNATDKQVSWSSSNSSVATVNGSGLVTAVAEGTAVITVKTQDGAKTATCQVTVKKKVIHVTGVTVDNWGLTLLINETGQIRYTVQPADATDNSVTFESSNPAVATVSSTGLVRAVSVGEARVTVTTTDGGFTAGCNVKVAEQVGLFEVDGIAYKYLTEHLVEVTSHNPKYSGTVNVPATVTYQDVEYSVYSIGDRAFYECPELVAVNLPEGLKYIGPYGFSGCPLLESITLPASFDFFDTGNPVFAYCPKLEISVSPDNPVWFVKDHALYRTDGPGRLYMCWLPEKITGIFTVLDGTTSLEEFSLKHTAIDKIIIPKSVAGIGIRFFDSSKTPLVIELNWTTKGEVDAIKNYQSQPEYFYFRDTDRSKVTVSVPKGTKALYEAHWLWSVLGGIIERDQ